MTSNVTISATTLTEGFRTSRFNVVTPESTHDIVVSMSRHHHDSSARVEFFLGFLNVVIVASFLGPKT